MLSDDRSLVGEKHIASTNEFETQLEDVPQEEDNRREDVQSVGDAKDETPPHNQIQVKNTERKNMPYQRGKDEPKKSSPLITLGLQNAIV